MKKATPKLAAPAKVVETPEQSAARQYLELEEELLQRKQDETLATEDDVEIRGWMRELWELMTPEDQIIADARAYSQLKKYGLIDIDLTKE